MASAFDRNPVDMRPTPKNADAREKKPLVARVKKQSTMPKYIHENIMSLIIGLSEGSRSL